MLGNSLLLHITDCTSVGAHHGLQVHVHHGLLHGSHVGHAGAVHHSVHLSLRPFISPFVRPSTYPFVHVSIYPSVRPSIFPSVRLPISPSTYFSFLGPLLNLLSYLFPHNFLSLKDIEQVSGEEMQSLIHSSNENAEIDSSL